jgi:hypothetical protein
MVRLRLLLPAILVLALALPALAENPKQDVQTYGMGPGTRLGLIDNSTWIDANNINMVVTNHGSFAYDLTTQDPGLEYPKGANKECVYASGIWIGALVGTEVRVTAGSFTQEYTPGPINEDGSWDDVGDPRHKVYKLVKGVTDSDDYLNWPSDLGAPVDGEGNPLIIGDQTLWCVYNDADPDVHKSDEGSTPPLGVEIQQTTFAFNWKGALGNTVFIKFKIINKLSNTLKDTYIAIWCDPDVGGASDDYVGCDTTLSVGFAYNATNQDNTYGGNPPCVGYDFFQGPKVGDVELPMTSFNMYINATDPRATAESYYYMQGLDLHGDPVYDPQTSEETKFMLPGDPVTNTGWIDSDPADRRFMMNTGPFTMEPGDTQEVVVGIVVGQGNDRIGSVKVMKFYDLTAQKAFDLDFDLPSPPDRPQVSVAPLDRRIRFSWGPESEIDRAPGYTFQGYNVYQSASVSAAGPWQLIEVFDIKDGLAVIEDLDLNIEFGVPIVQPVQFGTDAGIQRFVEITEDKVQGLPLYNGTPYYYQVAAYSYNPEPEEGLPKTLESFSEILRVIPQETASDVIIREEPSDVPVVQHVTSPEVLPTTDRVDIFITNPFELTGDTYRVDFQELAIPDTIVDGTDTTIAYYAWNLKNEATGLYVYEDWWTDKTGNNANYVVTDGFLAKLVGGHEEKVLARVEFVGPDGVRSPALTGVDWGAGYAINGSGGPGADYGINFFDSTLDPVDDKEEFVNVEVRMSQTATQRAYRYDRAAGYAFQDFAEVPFQVWDTDNNLQLNACFVENNEPGYPFNGTWDPDASDVGGREYLFIMKSEYDEAGGLYDDDNFGPEADVLYAVWPRLRSGYDFYNDVANGSILRFVWARPATDQHYFTFTPEDPDFSTAKAEGMLDEIRVVPNPYFAKSQYELDQFDHIVKFTNLPRRCTIRVFNLAGDLVRTLEKTDTETSILEWNLLNEKAIPVGSGFYIFHVDAPDIGSTFGRMAVFQSEERLNTF